MRTDFYRDCTDQGQISIGFVLKSADLCGGFVETCSYL